MWKIHLVWILYAAAASCLCYLIDSPAWWLPFTLASAVQVQLWLSQRRSGKL